MVRTPDRLVRIAAILSLFVLILAEVQAQQPMRIKLVGLDTIALPREEIKVPSSVTPSSRSELIVQLQQHQQTLLQTLRNRGYYLARIDSFAIDSGASAVRIYTAPGSQFRVGLLRIGGIDVSALDLRTQPGEILVEQELEADIDNVLQHLEQLGYPLASADIASISPRDHRTLDILILVHPGPQTTVSQLVVRGNTDTRAAVVTRESGVQLGAPYDPAVVRSGRDRIERLGYFKSVSVPTIELRADSTIAIVYEVEEARTTIIDAILGYNPPTNASQSGYVSGYLNLVFGNIAGTGRDAALQYRKENAGTQDLSVRYREPWLFNYPFHLSGSFEQHQQDSSYVGTNASIAGAYSFFGGVTAAVALRYDRVIPSELESLGFVAFNHSKLVTELSGAYDSRDNVWAPRTGVSIRGSGSYGTKRIEGPERFITDSISKKSAVSTFDLEVAGYAPTFTRNLVLALRGVAGRTEVFGSPLDQSDLRRLGGFSSLRGYRERELLANRFAYANLEYRILTARQSFIHVFTDVGWLERGPMVGAPGTVRMTALSYGLGAQQDTPLGLLSVSIGLRNDEPVDRAKLHFGLITRL